jgi:hypothetical protein
MLLVTIENVRLHHQQSSVPVRRQGSFYSTVFGV